MEVKVINDDFLFVLCDYLFNLKYSKKTYSMTLKEFLATIERQRNRSTRLYVPYYEIPDDETIQKFITELNEAINSFSDIPEHLRANMINACYWWYFNCLIRGGLCLHTASLKSVLRDIYRQYREDLKDFGKLMERVRKVFKIYCDLPRYQEKRR